VIPFVRLAETDKPGSAVMVSVDRPAGIAVEAIEPATVEVRGEGTSGIRQKSGDNGAKLDP
jgi:hypothetical protein